MTSVEAHFSAETSPAAALKLATERLCGGLWRALWQPRSVSGATLGVLACGRRRRLDLGILCCGRGLSPNSAQLAFAGFSPAASAPQGVGASGVSAWVRLRTLALPQTSASAPATCAVAPLPRGPLLETRSWTTLLRQRLRTTLPLYAASAPLAIALLATFFGPGVGRPTKPCGHTWTSTALALSTAPFRPST